MVRKNSFKTLSNFIFDNEIKLDNSNITTVCNHLDTLKENFDSYLRSETKRNEQINWISNHFQEHDELVINKNRVIII